MKRNLFVIVMAVCGKNVHIHLDLKDTVHETMLLGDFPAPSSYGAPLQWFRMAKSCFGMNLQFFYESIGLDKSFGFTLGKYGKMFHRLRGYDNLIYRSHCASRMCLSLHSEAWQHLLPFLSAVLPHQAWQNTPLGSSLSGRMSFLLRPSLFHHFLLFPMAKVTTSCGTAKRIRQKT